MRSLRIFLSIIILTLLFSCKDYLNLDKNSIILQNKSSNSGNTNFTEGIKIAILSDIHYMDPSLIVINGNAFQEYQATDPKQVFECDFILNSVVQELILQKPDLVLICGDLTKDGERVSHEAVVRILKQLTEKGIKVLVTPGDHDVNNPKAVKYVDASTSPVETIQTDEFQSMYADFGFKDAISKDPNSLSYVNEPIAGLRVITIDANKYYKNTTLSTVGGVIKPETMQWLKKQLVDAKNKGKTVIGMMHHGLIEHYAGQNQIDPGSVVDHSDATANKLIDAGMKIILTGHAYACDITKREHANKFIFDVETGSTIVFPFNIRKLIIKNNELSFETQGIVYNIGNNHQHGFYYYSSKYLSDHLEAYFANLLLNKFSVPSAEVPKVAGLLGYATTVHYLGDEPSAASLGGQLVYMNSVDPSGKLSWLQSTLWTDINTPDNLVTINMGTGKVQ